MFRKLVFEPGEPQFLYLRSSWASSSSDIFCSFFTIFYIFWILFYYKVRFYRHVHKTSSFFKKKLINRCYIIRWVAENKRILHFFITPFFSEFSDQNFNSIFFLDRKNFYWVFLLTKACLEKYSPNLFLTRKHWLEKIKNYSAIHFDWIFIWFCWFWKKSLKIRIGV